MRPVTWCRLERKKSDLFENLDFEKLHVFCEVELILPAVAHQVRIQHVIDFRGDCRETTETDNTSTIHACAHTRPQSVENSKQLHPTITLVINWKEEPVKETTQDEEGWSAHAHRNGSGCG